jgi:hypothetical protein
MHTSPPGPLARITSGFRRLVRHPGSLRIPPASPRLFQSSAAGSGRWPGGHS